jgi:hypothetical protein
VVTLVQDRACGKHAYPFADMDNYKVADNDKVADLLSEFLAQNGLDGK